MNNNKIDWKKKLTSRKFWAAVAGFVSMLILAFGVAEEVATQVASIIMAGATVIAYIFGEGLADSANALPDAIPIEGLEIVEDDEEVIE